VIAIAKFSILETFRIKHGIYAVRDKGHGQSDLYTIGVHIIVLQRKIIIISINRFENGIKQQQILSGNGNTILIHDSRIKNYHFASFS
jgi:hypothetical protein